MTSQHRRDVQDAQVAQKQTMQLCLRDSRQQIRCRPRPNPALRTHSRTSQTSSRRNNPSCTSTTIEMLWRPLRMKPRWIRYALGTTRAVCTLLRSPWAKREMSSVSLSFCYHILLSLMLISAMRRYLPVQDISFKFEKIDQDASLRSLDATELHLPR